METFALLLGWVVLTVSGAAVTAGIVYACVYWVTYFINNSHRRMAETIAGKGWLELLQKAAAEQEDRP